MKSEITVNEWDEKTRISAFLISSHVFKECIWKEDGVTVSGPIVPSLYSGTLVCEHNSFRKREIESEFSH